MFSYDPLLMLQSMSVQSYVNWIVVLDLTMDLGMVNTAEKIAGELMENMGPFPDIIYRRALIQIAKGNNDAAAVYLGKLANMPFYRTEVNRLLNMLNNNYGNETLIADGDSITTLSSRLGHAAWHPDGRIIAFSVYKVQQHFHAVGKQFIDVYDKTSRIVIYDVAGHTIIPVPQLNRQGVLDTWPAWSPDGRHLYFCSAPILSSNAITLQSSQQDRYASRSGSCSNRSKPGTSLPYQFLLTQQNAQPAPRPTTGNRLTIESNMRLSNSTL